MTRNAPPPTRCARVFFPALLLLPFNLFYCMMYSAFLFAPGFCLLPAVYFGRHALLFVLKAPFFFFFPEVGYFSLPTEFSLHHFLSLTRALRHVPPLSLSRHSLYRYTR